MKRITFLIVFCFLGIAIIKAQENQLQIIAGLKLNNIYKPPSEGNRFLMGYSIGLSYNKYLNKQMFLSSGLFLDEKGSGTEIDIYTETMDFKVRLFYLDLPIKYNYLITIGNQKLLIGLGPYIGCGLWGKISTEFMGQIDTYNIKWGNNGGDYDGTPNYKRLDFGFAGSVSYQVKRISLGLNYQIGVVDMVPEGLGGGERNNTFGFCLGYLILE
ncbi:MAG: outer membrane beta-barrel protein [Bacteroidetes bacterium]|nr:outer membrane beta-barrel protein [Bacteroidota bacterium]